MKSSRFKQEYRKSASKLHRTVGDILRKSVLFAGHKLYQEYPVNKINPDFPSGREKFDWVILDLKLVIECHGKQHEMPVAFGGDQEQAITAFEGQKYRDNMKLEAAIKAGYTYIAVYEKDKKHLTDQWLWMLYSGEIVEPGPKLTGPSFKPTKTADPKKEALKAKAKAFRRQQYERAKQFKEQLKHG